MLDKFPGLLGYGGIIAIHANWPMYPSGIGWQIALKTLGSFPRETKFYEISDIDRCKLLINKNPEKLTDPFESTHYHVAVWHEDLIELKKKGLVSGVAEKSEYEFELLRFEKFRTILGGALKEDDNGNIISYIKGSNGQFQEIKYLKPKPDEDDDDFIFRDCATISESLNLTANGVDELIKLSNEIRFTDELFSLTDPLIKIRRFDTAVRDASLLLETRIKKFHNRPDLYGQRLVEFHLREIIKNNNDFNSAAIKCYRGELRTIFGFIRNDFAHNFRVLTEEQCKAILSRINDALCEFDEVVNAYFKKNSI